jgi:regulator of protease activity HflC (stomatin/prohibitin superfamily)
MKRTFSLLAPAMLMAGCINIAPGYRGVRVLVSDNRVDPTALEVGRHWYWPYSTTVFTFPVHQQNHIWAAGRRLGGRDDKSITLQTMDGLSVNADVGISYSIAPQKVVQIFSKYPGGIAEITDVYLRNLVMDAFNAVASGMPVETVFGQGRRKLLVEVNDIVRNRVAPEGILVDQIYVVGDFRVPPLVVTAINAKIEARQRAKQREYEIKEAEAEAAKKLATAKGEAEAAEIRARGEARAVKIRAEGEADAVSIRAKAEADANTLVAKSLAPPLLRYESLRRWDGRLPLSTGDKGVPLLNLDAFIGGVQK